ncbi:MAG: patatin-like phospholipase family protein [Bryobacterales bacterium]|nr:patatin-like phospholipase family protein [Bryobacterales bacterium]
MRALAFFGLVCLSMPAAERPKIGLVLGGGGALGLSHVGVIQWLEEQRIPVGIVAGTSMGGLVGGLYATGKSPDELGDFVAQIDWDDALRTGPSFDQLTFRRREDRREFPNQMQLAVSKGLRLPAGLSAGHGVGVVLSRFTGAYGDITDFNELPIPFACVATDLVRGEKVVLRRGRLFDALRATMAIPGLFTPWKIGSQVLVDGGTLDNLPVAVAREMGADVVIAVVLETPPITGKAVESLLGVAARSISVMIANNEKASMAQADFIVAPALKGFSSSDYQRSGQLRQVGYEAAQKVAALRKYALEPEEWAKHLEQRQSRRRSVPEPAGLAVAGVPEQERELLERDLRPAIGAGAFDERRLERALGGIAGSGLYDSADYRFTRNAAGPVLEVNARPNPRGHWSLDILPQFEAASGEGSRFGMGGRLKILAAGSVASEWRIDVLGGAGNTGAGAEYYWRPGASRFFIAPRIAAESQLIPFRKDGRLLAELGVDRRYADLSAGWAISREAEMRIGLRVASANAQLASGTLPVPESEGGSTSVRMQYRYYGQDSALIPRRGFRISADAEWVARGPGGVKPFAVGDGNIAWAKPINSRLSVLTAFSGGAAPARGGIQALFTLGGISRLTALSRNQLFGQRYYLAQGGLLREMRSSSFARIFAAGIYEAGAVHLRGFDAPTYHSGSAGLLAETYLGIVYVGAGVGDKGERKVFFRLGRLF